MTKVVFGLEQTRSDIPAGKKERHESLFLMTRQAALKNLLVFVDKVFAVSRDCTDGVGVAVTAQCLGTPGVLSAATIA